MIIRESKAEDYDQLATIGQKYANETLLGRLEPGNIAAIIKSCSSNGIVLIAEVDDRIVGIIAGIFLSGFIKGKFFDEVIWYVEPKYRGIGVKLFRRALHLCEQAGCDGIGMTAYNNDQMDLVERFYKKNGFKEVERRYYKHIGG